MFDNWKNKKIEQVRESEIVEFHNEQQLEDMRKLMKKKRKGLHKDGVLDFNDFKVEFWFDFKEDVKIIARGLTIAGDTQVQVGDIECSQYIEVHDGSKLYAGDISCTNLTVGFSSYLEAKNVDVHSLKASVPVEINGSIKANDINTNYSGINFYCDGDESCEYTFNDIISKNDIKVSGGTLKANDLRANRFDCDDSKVDIRDIYASVIKGTGSLNTRDMNVNHVEEVGYLGYGLNIIARDIQSNTENATLEASSVKAKSIKDDSWEDATNHYFKDIRIESLLDVGEVYSRDIRVGSMKADKVRFWTTCVVMNSLDCKDISGLYENKGLISEIRGK